VLESVPDESRLASGSGDPRSSNYWILWSSCSEDNRAETAEANGGREAGWIILDDLLEEPGIALADHQVSSCEEGVAILSGPGSDDAAALSRQLLTAELNLNVGSETCPVADESVAAGHLLLASAGFEGPTGSADTLDSEEAASAEQVTELLFLYNSGRLCR
jgi:hypothetical protein